MGCVSSTSVQHELNLVPPLNCHAFEQPVKQGKQRQFHDDYLLKGKLGKGAFAQVHLAHKADDESVVAVKITDLRGGGSGKDGQKDEVDLRCLRSVTKESRILKLIGVQKHCVAFYDDYIEGPLSYMVMERCDSTLLHAMERAPELTEQTLANIFGQMLLGIEAVHRLRVVHRDVKPDNFLCSGSRCTVKLCDFGLAEVLPPQNPELKGVYGTAPFMSPEMLGSGTYNATTDVWSLGVIAYVLLFGHFPYQPIETSAKAMKAAIHTGVPAPTFKPKASIDNGSIRTSAEAMDFLHATLDRNKNTRLTASSALKMPWIAQAEEGSRNYSSASLRPMLSSAKRVGAFDTRGHHPNEKPSAVDMLLRQHLNSGENFRRASTRSESSAMSEHVYYGASSSSRAKPQHLNLDSCSKSLVQSHGAQSNTSNSTTATGTSRVSCMSSSGKREHRSPMAGDA